MTGGLTGGEGHDRGVVMTESGRALGPSLTKGTPPPPTRGGGGGSDRPSPQIHPSYARPHPSYLKHHPSYRDGYIIMKVPTPKVQDARFQDATPRGSADGAAHHSSCVIVFMVMYCPCMHHVRWHGCSELWSVFFCTSFVVSYVVCLRVCLK